MKLALSTVEGIAVLTGTGEISIHDLDVLRAGLTKLLKSGRNRIVLEFPEAEIIPDAIIRELSKFDLLARELSGRVVLAGNNEKFRKRVLQFAQPPVIECFDGKSFAVQYFAPPAPTVTTKPATTTPTPPPAKAAPVAVAAVVATPAPAGASTTDPKQQFKTEIRQRELTEATDLRKRISDLENENQLLTKQLHAAWLASRTAPTQQAQQGELEALKQRMEEVLEHSKATQAK